MIKQLIVVASLAAASATIASAAPTRLNDAQYVAAARCQALISSPVLGKGDTSVIDAVLKSEGRDRTEIVYDRADEARADAAREARHAGAAARAELTAERDGVCQAWNGGAGSTMASTQAQPAGAN